MKEIRLLSLEAGVRDEDEDSFKGVQAGLANEVEEMYGLQAAAVNYAYETRGIQAGLWSSSERAYGVQFGGMNLVGQTYSSEDGELKGVQAGLFNGASKAKGVQAGICNIVREADRVVQIGALCKIGSNPWYAKYLPFFNYGGSMAKRERRKRLKKELLEKEQEEMRKNKINVKV